MRRGSRWRLRRAWRSSCRGEKAQDVSHASLHRVRAVSAWEVSAQAKWHALLLYERAMPGWLLRATRVAKRGLRGTSSVILRRARRPECHRVAHHATAEGARDCAADRAPTAVGIALAGPGAGTASAGSTEEGARGAHHAVVTADGTRIGVADCVAHVVDTDARRASSTRGKTALRGLASRSARHGIALRRATRILITDLG